VLSLAGFGGTPAQPTDGPMLEAVREELATYITKHDLNQPTIVGHSLGGFLALDLAVHHPELTGKLVIVDSLPFIYGIMQPGATVADAKQAAKATASAFSQMNPDTYAKMIRNGPNGSTMAASENDIDRIIDWGLASDGASVAKALGELYSADLRSELSKVGSPTLVLAAWIGYAPYTNHDSAAQTYRQQYAGLNNVQIEITDTARHFIMLDEPEWMFARIETFLSTSGSATSSN
jgi:pimeloyl-ACP methyl ester carboxylesterase